MGVNKTFDEMADRFQYFGDKYLIMNERNGFGEVWMRLAFVDLSEGNDTFWLMVSRKANDWHWIHETDFILLVDGKRFTGVGAVRDSEVTEEPAFFETKILCNEEIHCGGDLELLRMIAESSSAKFRLGNVDFVLPATIISDAQEIMKDIKATGGYGL